MGLLKLFLDEGDVRDGVLILHNITLCKLAFICFLRPIKSLGWSMRVRKIDTMVIQLLIYHTNPWTVTRNWEKIAEL